jgi:ankyrin repeat protein
MLNISPDDPLALAAVAAIRNGDLEALNRLLRDNPNLAIARIGTSRTLLHIATDWPGNFPHSAATIAALIRSGAEVDARSTGPPAETPLHWAASSDDVAALDVLLDHGADIEASGALIGGGTPLGDAVAFGQWRAARRLVERGARTTLWQAAALGLMPRIKEYFAINALPAPDEVTNAFWCACHGGQRSAAEYLFHRGADLTGLDITS